MLADDCAILRAMISHRLGAIAAFGVLVASGLPACAATANVSDVWMSIDEDGARRRNVFFTDSSNITCIAEVGIGRRDATLEMLFRQIRAAPFGTDAFEEVNKVVLAREFHPDITTDGPALVNLTLRPMSLDTDGLLKEDDQAPYEPGSYLCEVMLDGVKRESAAFNIEYAPCPTAIIQEGVPCKGFYTVGTRCPVNGASGQPEPTCSCEEQGWTCT